MGKNVDFSLSLKFILSAFRLLSEKINYYMSQNKKNIEPENDSFAQLPTKIIGAKRTMIPTNFPKAFPFQPALNVPLQKNKVEKELTEEEKKE